MTLYEFNGLPEAEKEAAIEVAVLIASRKTEAHRIYLFQIDGFYLEVSCSLFSPVLDRRRSFSSMSQLEPYLDQIKLDF